MNNQCISLLTATLGEDAVLTDTAEIAPFVRESRGHVTGAARAVLLPSTTQHVADVVRVCNEHGVVMVVQGGNTGRNLGAWCDDSDAVVISTNRLNRIREIDVTNRSMTVEAGVVLERIQHHAEQHELLFPLSIGAQGSCQIGGNLATNCGGMNTVRYGNTRDMVLGIEAVMPNGEIMNTLTKLRKNNMGYDLRHLLIGSEGTLGIITACTLKLFPPEKCDSQAFVGMHSVDAAVALLNHLQSAFVGQISTFELLPKRALSYIESHTDLALPLENQHDWYVWYRIAGTSDEIDDAHVDFLTQLDELSENKYHFVFAQHSRHKAQFRSIREAIVSVQKHANAQIKFDVSVPVATISEFIQRGKRIGDALGFLAYPFGHVGDGNIHFNFSPPEMLSDAEINTRKDELDTQMYDLVVSLGGSVSAEHGIGRRKLDIMMRYQDPVAIRTMQAIKHALDPKGLMNPDKVIVNM